MKKLAQRVPVAVLGATGAVGQRFVALLEGHPWFEVREVQASARSAGKSYGDAVQWMLPTPIPEDVAKLRVGRVGESVAAELCFSALDTSIALDLERELAGQNKIVCSNASAWRMDPCVPLVVPEVNPEHLALMDAQTDWPGTILTNPNCSTIGLTLALRPLQVAFGIESVSVVTLQALSGAGRPTASALDVLGNVVPFIPGEGEKLERETLKILGELTAQQIRPASFSVGAQCNRVPVLDGHMLCVTVDLTEQVSEAQLCSAWSEFAGAAAGLGLPSAPTPVVILHEEESGPQPRLHIDAGRGMAVHVGRVRHRGEGSWQFVSLSHNTVRGAAGGSILLAELALASGRFEALPSPR